MTKITKYFETMTNKTKKSSLATKVVRAIMRLLGIEKTQVLTNYKVVRTKTRYKVIAQIGRKTFVVKEYLRNGDKCQDGDARFFAHELERVLNFSSSSYLNCTTDEY